MGKIIRHVRQLNGLNELMLKICFQRQFDIGHVSAYPIGFLPFFSIQQDDTAPGAARMPNSICAPSSAGPVAQEEQIN